MAEYRLLVVVADYPIFTLFDKNKIGEVQKTKKYAAMVTNI